MAVKTRDDAIKKLKRALDEEVLDIILENLDQIRDSKIFGEHADEFKTLKINVRESKKPQDAKLLINNFLSHILTVNTIGIIASDIFIKKFNDLDENTRTRVITLINKIVKDKTSYPLETVGYYNSSPRGSNDLRIIWRLDGSNVMFEDLHKHDFRYDNLITQLRYRKINPRDNYFGDYRLI